MPKQKKHVKEVRGHSQDGRVMIAARIDEALVREMKKHGIDRRMAYREIIEQAIREYLAHHGNKKYNKK